MVAMLVEAHLAPHVLEFVSLARKMLPSRATMRDDSGPAANLFHHDGDLWHIRYAGANGVVAHIAGMGYIASLLAAPAVQFDCQQLDQSVRDVGVYEPAVDRGALTAYASRITAIDTLDANRQLTAELAAERDELEKAIRGAKGLYGRSRRAVSEKERSRTRVSKAIERAFLSIEKRNQRLGAHLRQAIRRGGTLVYLPESSVRWEL